MNDLAGVYEDVTSNDLSGIYKEVAEAIGIESVHQLFLHFKGLQLVFPLKFYSCEYMSHKIRTEYENGKSVRELSREYGYSESRVRQMVKGMHPK